MDLSQLNYDPILEEIDAELVAQQSKELPRQYLGASAIGGNCERALFYNFRWASSRSINASGLKAIADGHAVEQVMIKRLRSVMGVELFVDEDGKQIGFTDLSGHYQGSVDGIIRHEWLGEAIWENKATNVTKTEKLKKLKAEDESTALKRWDTTYYYQAQVYMHHLGFRRHYLTCCTPGGREVISVITEYNEHDAMMMRDRAERVIFGERPSVRASSDPAFYSCKWCNHWGICHASETPQVNCRTCAHSTPNRDGGWTCVKFEVALSFEDQLVGCFQHRFNPVLINGTAVERDEDDVITYRMSSGDTFKDGNK